jgi:hypothetical protein
MSSHLFEVAKAADQAYQEAKKLENSLKSATNPQEKEKLKKFAEAAKKQTLALYSQVEPAKQKDLKEIMTICEHVASAAMGRG